MSITNADYEVGFTINYWSHIIKTLTIRFAKYFIQLLSYHFNVSKVSTKKKLIGLDLVNIH
jgi:hypothetical protein